MIKIVAILFSIGAFSSGSVIRTELNARDDSQIFCTYREPISGYGYTCNLNIQNPLGLNNFTTIGGNHIEGFTDADVETLYISNQNTRNIPSIICQQFPNIIELVIGMSQTEIIDRNSFSGCANLEFLIISSNNIQFIPSDTFFNNSNLEIVMLPNNRIRGIGANVFRGTKVIYVDLDENELREFEPEWFNGIEEQLQMLILSSNRFPTFVAFGFERLTNLKELDISLNPITNLYQNIFLGLSSLQRLYMSKINITTVNPNWFTPLTAIEHIFLSYNRIRDVPDNSFHNLPNLQTVDFSDNDLTFIRASAFGNSIGHLRYLSLIYNNILALDERILEEADTLKWLLLSNNECFSSNFYNVQDERDQVLNDLQQCFTNFVGTARCQFVDIEWFPYECLLFIINPVGNDFESIEGEHVSGKTNNDVMIVETLYQNTRNFPPVICRQFPSVELIFMEESRIEILEADAFVNCGHLREIIMSFNRIASIPDGLFRNNPMLTIFVAASNLINHIGLAAFNGTQLEDINLNSNRLGEFNAQPFEDIAETLKYLYLADNSFGSLPSNAFGQLINLEELNLSGNNLSNIPSNIFRTLENLKDLNLNECELGILDPELFENLQSLEELRLDNNNLQSIPSGTFLNIRALEIISITGNFIRNIHATSFGNLHSLLYFYAAGNGIRAIDREFYDSATEMRSLYLDENICTSLNFLDVVGNRESVRQELSECFRMFDGFINCNFYDSFYYVCRLELQNILGRDDFTEITGEHYENRTDIDVRYVEAEEQDSRNIPSIICRQFPNTMDLYIQKSFIEFIDENAFEYCHNLEFLRLSDNHITSIPDFTFIHTPRLTSLELYKNMILSIGSNAFSGISLGMIDLEDNLLTTIDSRWFASSSESLMYVYIPLNRLKQLPENAFVNFGSVIIFDIGINPEIELPFNVFQPMRELTILFADNCGIRHIDSRWFHRLPELRHLILSENRITNLQPGVFDQIPNLQNIDVGANKIPNINSDAFGSVLPILRYFYNDDNPTTAIDAQFFDNAPQLVSLLFNHNLCVNGNFYNVHLNRIFVREQLELCFSNFEIRERPICFYYSIQTRSVCSLKVQNPHGHDDFDGIESEESEVAIENVNYVQAINQNTRVVPRILCDKFTGLETINLYQSRIQQLTQNALNNCRSLINLQLMYNEITTIEAGAFNGAINLQYLELEGNRIHSISDNAFAGTGLNFLYIGLNQLNTINRNMLNGIQDTLIELFLYMNNLIEITEDAFEGLDQLTYLDLGVNFGLQLPSNVFLPLRNLKYLYLDSLGLETINPDWFVELENLKNLDIYRNNIQSLPRGVFSYLPSLEAVILNNNPIEVLNSNIFGDNIRNIEYINAVGCSIDAIDERLLDETNSLDLLSLFNNICISSNFFDIKNNRDQVKERLAPCLENFRGSIACHYFIDPNEQYSCILSISNLAGHDQFTTIQGEHEANTGDSDVIMVQSMYQVTRNIPSIICDQFKNVEEIFIEDSRVESITVENCRHLQRLILAYNEISAIEDGTFRNNPNLELLDLHFNRIVTIANDAFAGSRIAVLNIGSNPLRRFIPAWTAVINETLRDLRIYDSQVLEIVDFTFENLRNLEFLDIGLNPNLIVSESAFDTLENLQSMFLDTCGLRSLNPRWFQNLPALRDLHLHSNNLREFPAGLFERLNISYLSFRDNRISTINSNAFGNSLKTIEFFYGLNNRINAIDQSFFNNAVNLDSLYLLNNICVDENFREVVLSRDFVSEELGQCFDNFQ